MRERNGEVGGQIGYVVGSFSTTKAGDANYKRNKLLLNFPLRTKECVASFEDVLEDGDAKNQFVSYNIVVQNFFN